MRLTSALIVSLLLAMSVVLASSSTREEQAPRQLTTGLRTEAGVSQTTGDPQATLVAHEWGTFTSFSGSDGVKLEFRPLEDSDLPPFVSNLVKHSGLITKFDLTALVRMETPVIYFYSDRDREVAVQVRFPRGLLTEFFPPVDYHEPSFSQVAKGQMSGAMLNWPRVRLLPAGQTSAADAVAELGSESLLPAVAQGNHYGYARETDAAMVHVHVPRVVRGFGTPHGDFYEKFLFYRGVGNFPLPLTLRAQAENRFELTNTGPEPIRSLFLVTVDGEHLRFARFDRIGAGENLLLEQSAQTSSRDELAEAVVQALIAENLYEKEARAMVKTWRSSWFEEDGTRLFYMLPRRLTDELLPLQISPPPDDTVRVMVGRMEIMTPEEEARITQLVRDSAAVRAAAAEEGSAPPEVPDSIRDLGRLAEPALLRVANTASEEDVRKEAGRLLSRLRAPRHRSDSSSPSPTNWAEIGLFLETAGRCPDSCLQPALEVVQPPFERDKASGTAKQRH